MRAIRIIKLLVKYALKVKFVLYMQLSIQNQKNTTTSCLVHLLRHQLWNCISLIIWLSLILPHSRQHNLFLAIQKIHLYLTLFFLVSNFQHCLQTGSFNNLLSNFFTPANTNTAIKSKGYIKFYITNTSEYRYLAVSGALTST